MSSDADEKTLSLVAQAERQALAFYARPDEATQRAFENSVHTLQEVELNPQWLAELQLQVRLLLENVSPPQA